MKKIMVALLAVMLVLIAVISGTFSAIPGKSLDFQEIQKGTARSEEERTQILLSDLSESDWEALETSSENISKIVKEFSNEDGYIEQRDTEAVLTEVTAYVDKLYQDGVISCYSATMSEVCFEYASGLQAIYTPAYEGYSSGGNDCAVVTIDPFASGTNNQSMTNQAYQSGNIYFT